MVDLDPQGYLKQFNLDLVRVLCASEIFHPQTPTSRIIQVRNTQPPKEMQNEQEVFPRSKLHSGKLAWQWKVDLLKMFSLLDIGKFHCYVSLLEGTTREISQRKYHSLKLNSSFRPLKRSPIFEAFWVFIIFNPSICNLRTVSLREFAFFVHENPTFKVFWSLRSTNFFISQQKFVANLNGGRCDLYLASKDVSRSCVTLPHKKSPSKS